jgi:hypothetical protein
MLEEFKHMHRNFSKLKCPRKEDVESLQASLAKLSPQTFREDACDRNRVVKALEAVEDLLGPHGEALGRFKREEAVLRSLLSPDMTDRYDAILEAHTKTFEWILGDNHWPEADPRHNIRFAEWLRDGDGLYWVSGKPGSGKSTLMKYLAGHQTTKRILSEWSKGKPLVVAQYYFWIGGSQAQRSLRDLMEQLLFQLFRSYPDLIHQVFPPNVEFEGQGIQLSLQQLRASFRCLSALDENPTCMCFFIDGLDEYNGDHDNLIEFLRELSDSPNIKVCVASRPWNCFEDVFGQTKSQKLYVQQLTSQDITVYTRDHLRKMIQSYTFSSYGTLTDKLVSEVVTRAQGVFLWVFLVMRSLKEGFVNADDPEVLYDRLLELPTDLEGLFERMIFSVNNVYRRAMYATFQVMLTSSQPLPLLMFLFMDHVTKVNAALSDDRLGYSSVTEPESIARRQVNGRYKGLLEIHDHEEPVTVQLYHQQTRKDSGLPLRLPSWRIFRYEILLDIQGHVHDKSAAAVQFFHRTVRDYLELPDMQDKFKRLLGNAFTPTHTGCNALLSLALTWPERWCRYSMSLFLCLARSAQEKGNPINVLVVDQLHDALITSSVASTVSLNFNVIKYALSDYVRHQLSQGTMLLEQHGDKYLELAILVWEMSANDTDSPYYHDIIRLLLSHGVDPNAVVPNPQSTTPGKHISIFGIFLRRLRSITSLYNWQDVLFHFLNNGAYAQQALLPIVLRESFFDMTLQSLLQKPTKTILGTCSNLPGIFSLFFQHGFDPNTDLTQDSVQGEPEKYIKGNTPWKLFLHTPIIYRTRFTDRMSLHAEIMLLFLKHGADPFACIWATEGDSFSRLLGSTYAVNLGRDRLIPKTIIESLTQGPRTKYKLAMEEYLSSSIWFDADAEIQNDGQSEGVGVEDIITYCFGGTGLERELEAELKKQRGTHK